MINRAWSTKRLLVVDSTVEDLSQLERVLMSNSETLLLDGVRCPDVGELRRWLIEGDLPPGGELEKYRLQTVSRAGDGEAIGYFSVYHGYPDGDTLYISSLFIRQDCQGQGFGGEVIDVLPALDGLLNYPIHRLVVTVRNWGAVRFWTRCGFTTIARVEGELNTNNGSSARLELARNASQWEAQGKP